MGGVLDWLRGIGSALLQAGRTIGEAVSDLLGFTRDIDQAPPDAAALQSVLQQESRILGVESTKEAQSLFAWSSGQEGPSLIPTDQPLPLDMIRTLQRETRHQYVAFVKITGPGGDTWAALNYDSPPTPEMVKRDVERKLEEEGDWKYKFEETGGEGGMTKFEVTRGVNWETYGWSPGEFL